MAIVDREQGRCVIRVVYDGPALAGKTTSVRALARSLGRPFFSGDEAEGRTLHFDWLDYEGGRFEGLPIRCEVVAVPGQPALSSRRAHLLDAADAVVFVADSRRSAAEDSLRALDELRARLGAARPPAPAIVLQANKRDDADALALPELRARLTLGATVGVTESVAPEGHGIRETFVFAVRLALDRVRELRAAGRLDDDIRRLDGPEDLLAEMLAAERDTAPTPEVNAVPEPARVMADCDPVPDERLRASVEMPLPPDGAVAAGLVWPPVEGRLLLHEVHAVGVQPRVLPNEDWQADVGGLWRCHAHRAARFTDLEAGRSALVAWARRLAGAGRLLSPGRCIALSAGERGWWRLWQIVRTTPSLRDDLDRVLLRRDPDLTARSLLGVLGALAEIAPRVLEAGLPLAASKLGAVDGGIAFIGLAPYVHGADGLAPMARLRLALAPLVESARAAHASAVVTVVDRVGAHAALAPSREMAEMLQAQLIGHA